MNKKLSLLLCFAVLVVCLLGAVACEIVDTHEHNYIEHAAVAATCDTAGNELYYTCKGCDKMFDKDKQEITAVPTIAAKGHVYAEHAAVIATCTSDGNELYYTCDVCNKIFDKDKAEIQAIPTVAKGEHGYSKVEAKAATCTESGNEEYYTCAGCNGLFDKDKKSITAIPVIPAKNHALHKVGSLAPTCEQAGNEEYYTCDNGCGTLFGADQHEIDEVPVIPAKGHKYHAHDKVEATCETNGTEAYFTCDNGCDKLFDADKKAIDKVVVIPALGHAYAWEENSGNHTAELKCTRTGCTSSKGTIRTELDENDRLLVDYDSTGDMCYDLTKFGDGLYAVNVSYDNKTLVVDSNNDGALKVNISDLFAHSVKMGKTFVTISVKMDEGPSIYVNAPITLAKLINDIDDLLAIRPTIIDGRATVTGGTVKEENGHKEVVRYYYVLTADIDGDEDGLGVKTVFGGTSFSDEGFASGDGKSGFVGIFDGNNHTVRNFTLNVRGFFGHVGGGTITNVTFSDIVLNNPDSAVLGKLMGATISNVTIANIKTAAELSDTAGIVAYHEIYGSTIDKLTVDLRNGLAKGHVLARQLTDGTGDWHANEFSNIVVMAPYNQGLDLTANAELTDKIDGVAVKFNPFTVEKPVADDTTHYYTGHELTYNIADSDLYTVSGNKQTDVGTYTVTVSLKPYDGLTWADGTTADVTFTFEIVNMPDEVAAELAQTFAAKVTELGESLQLPCDKMAVDLLVAEYENLHDKVKARLTETKTALDGLKTQADKYTQLEVVINDKIVDKIVGYDKVYVVVYNNNDTAFTLRIDESVTWHSVATANIDANSVAQLELEGKIAAQGNNYLYVNGNSFKYNENTDTWKIIVYGMRDEAKAQELLAAFNTAVDAISDPLTADDADAIVAARAAYDALTPYALTLVDADKVTKLVNAEAAIGALVDQAAAKNVADMIDALTNDSTAEEIQGARIAYNRLTDEQKKLVTNLDKLAVAEQRIVDEIAAEFKAKVDALGTPSFPRDNDVVVALKAEFDGLIEAVKEKLGETKETLNKYIESASQYIRLTPTFSDVKMSALNGYSSYMIVFTNETDSDIVFTYAADVPNWTDSGESYTLVKGTTMVGTIKKNFAENGIYPYLGGQSKKMDAIEGLTIKVYGKKAVVGSEEVALSVNGTIDDPTYGKVLSGTIYDLGNTTQAWLQPYGFISLDNYNTLKQYADKDLHFYLYNPCGEDITVTFYMMDRKAWWPYYDQVTLKAGWNRISISGIFADENVNESGVQPTISATDVTALVQTGWMISDFYYTVA